MAKAEREEAQWQQPVRLGRRGMPGKLFSVLHNVGVTIIGVIIANRWSTAWVVAAIAIGGAVLVARVPRIEFEFDERGVTIRNLWRTLVFSWAEVREIIWDAPFTICPLLGTGAAKYVLIFRMRDRRVGFPAQATFCLGKKNKAWLMERLRAAAEPWGVVLYPPR